MAKNTSTERAAIRVARNIVQDIQDRALRPGTPLDPEYVMVEKLGVARATVREALRFLELQGALRIKAGPGGGPVVNVPHTDHLASAISLQLQFANASFQAVIDARMSIYPVLAGEAAQTATHQHIQAIQQSIARMRAAVKDSDLLTYEAQQFHNLVADASGNMVLAIEAGDAENARKVTVDMLAAALRYWKKNAPDLLDSPVSWLADLPRGNLLLPELQATQL